MAGADKFKREIELDDALLLGMVKEKGDMVEKGRIITKQMEDLARQHEKLHKELTELSTTINNKKLDIIKRVKMFAKGLLGEYEIPLTTEIKDGKVVLVVSHALDEFKASFEQFDPWKHPVPRLKRTLKNST